MRKLAVRIIALVCAASFVLSLAACNSKDHGHSGGRRSGSGSKTERNETEPTPGVDPTIPVIISPTPSVYGDYIPTSDALTYPDHVATYDEIHPYHAPGTVNGSAAQKLLSDVEMDILHHEIDC